jgi:hypothetical protein
MPSKLRAGGTFPFILADDRGDTTEPQFNIRVLSVLENDQLGQIRNSFINESHPAKRSELLNTALAMTVADCLLEQVSGEPMLSFLTPLECWELINAATEGASLTAEQRKKFVSPPLSETDSSAEGAAASA